MCSVSKVRVSKVWILEVLRRCAWSRRPDVHMCSSACGTLVPSILGPGLVNIGQPPDHAGSRIPLIFSGLKFSNMGGLYFYNRSRMAFQSCMACPEEPEFDQT